MTRRREAIAVGLFCLVLAAAGCSPVLGRVLPDAGGDVTPVDPTPAAGEVTLTLYFPDRQAEYVLAETRSVTFKGNSLAEAAVEALLGGPEAGYLWGALPQQARLLGVEVRDGVAYVNLSDSARVAGTAGERAAVLSLVLTLTELDGVDRVQVLIEGRTGVSLGGHFLWSEPIGREDIGDGTGWPAIVAGSAQIKLFSPAPGTTVNGSFELAGIAQVYEATVRYDLTLGGELLIDDFTTATDWDWGTFRTQVTLPFGVRGEAVLRVYSESAEDGRPLHLVEVPLTIR